MSYQFFYAGPRMKRSQELKRAQQERLEASQPQAMPTAGDSLGTSGASVGARESDSIAIDTDVAASELPKATSYDAKFISVVTPHYEITLSTRGGEVVSVRLFEWETDGEPVQLVRGDPAVDGGLLQITLTGDDAMMHPLSGSRASMVQSFPKIYLRYVRMFDMRKRATMSIILNIALIYSEISSSVPTA